MRVGRNSWRCRHQGPCSPAQVLGSLLSTRRSLMVVSRRRDAIGSETGKVTGPGGGGRSPFRGKTKSSQVPLEGFAANRARPELPLPVNNGDSTVLSEKQSRVEEARTESNRDQWPLSRQHRAPIIRSFSGQVAQLVEQRTENPCVGSSILPLATRFLRLPAMDGGRFSFSCFRLHVTAM